MIRSAFLLYLRKSTPSVISHQSLKNVVQELVVEGACASRKLR